MVCFNNSVILFGGISLVVLSACSPRGSVTNGVTTQNSSVAQTAFAPIGVNNEPLYTGNYTGNIASQQLSATMLPIESATMSAFDNIATGSITPQTALQPNSANIYQDPAHKSYSATPETAYQVQTGDTIYSIGRKFSVHPGEIIARNNINNPNQLIVGQSFKIPTNGHYTAGNTNITPYQTPQAVQKYVPAFPQTTSGANISQSYTVQSGDTLYSIGRKFNVHPTYIINKNPLVNPNQLVPGQTINIASNTINAPVITGSVNTPKTTVINPPLKAVIANNNQKNIMGDTVTSNKKEDARWIPPGIFRFFTSAGRWRLLVGGCVLRDFPVRHVARAGVLNGCFVASNFVTLEHHEDVDQLF